jgi:hypothetical protein
MPKIKVRFRTYKSVPFAIEQFTGVQYRCRVCNRVFQDKKEFEAHLQTEAAQKAPVKVSPKVPKPGQMTTEKLLYTLDIHDHLHRDFLHLKDNIAFDPQPLKSNTHKNKGD